MKIYSFKTQDMADFVFETRNEDFEIEHHQQLGEYEGRAYFSFNPDTVELGENDEKYEMKVYDKNDADDAAHLDLVKTKLFYVKEKVVQEKSKMFNDHDIFTLLHGVATEESNVLDLLNNIKAAVDKVYSDFGF